VYAPISTGLQSLYPYRRRFTVGRVAGLS